MRKKYLWKKAIQKSCNATEGIDSSFANYLIKSASIKRHFYWINGKNHWITYIGASLLQ